MSEEVIYDVIRRCRHRNSFGVDDGIFGGCDFTSYCYFALAFVMFSLGTIITVLALDDHEGTPMFRGLGHMWLIGPIFISSGLMVAIKTVLYLRKKNLLALILRQRAIFRELQRIHTGRPFQRNPSTLTLPPSYDSVVREGGSADGDVPETRRCTCMHARSEANDRPNVVVSQTVKHNSNAGTIPPPTYEEAMSLLRTTSLLPSDCDDWNEQDHSNNPGSLADTSNDILNQEQRELLNGAKDECVSQTQLDSTT